MKSIFKQVFKSLIWGFLCLLSACNTMVPKPHNVLVIAEPSPIFQESLLVTGRLLIRSLKSDHTKIIQGNFKWDQTPEKTILTLYSPLGNTLATIEIQPNESRFIQGNQIIYTAQDSDTLASQLNWPLPISHLAQWLQGFVVDAQGALLSASPTHKNLAAQGGWNLSYTTWEQEVTQPYSRPKQIDLEHDTQEGAKISARIILDSWSAP